MIFGLSSMSRWRTLGSIGSSGVQAKMVSWVVGVPRLPLLFVGERLVEAVTTAMRVKLLELIVTRLVLDDTGYDLATTTAATRLTIESSNGLGDLRQILAALPDCYVYHRGVIALKLLQHGGFNLC